MEQHSSPFLMSSDHVSRRHQWFTCVHLLISHLTQSSCAFSVTLTTPALYRRSLRWFGGCFQKPPPEGLPPSQLQLRADRLCSRVTPVSLWFPSFQGLLRHPLAGVTRFQACSVPLRTDTVHRPGAWPDPPMTAQASPVAETAAEVPEPRFH